MSNARRVVAAGLAALALSACGGLVGGSTVPDQVKSGQDAANHARDVADHVEQMQSERMADLNDLGD
jgi:hypothetical protein